MTKQDRKTTSKSNATKKKTTKKKAAPKKVAPKKAIKKAIKKKAVKKKAAATRKKSAKKSKISSEEKRMIVALHAYYKWESAGRPDNTETHHWLEAEEEIENMLKMK